MDPMPTITVPAVQLLNKRIAASNEMAESFVTAVLRRNIPTRQRGHPVGKRSTETSSSARLDPSAVETATVDAHHSLGSFGKE